MACAGSKSPPRLGRRKHLAYIAPLFLLFIISSTVLSTNQALVGCNPNASSSESVIARYTVEITPAGAAKHEVSVKAVIPLGAATDLTVTSPDQGFKARWITIERCYDSANRIVLIEQVDNRTWRVSPSSAGEVTIEYTACADIPSSAAVGYYLTYLSESCGLLYASAITLLPPTQGEVEVNFIIPSGWSVIADETWSPVNSTAFTVGTGDLELFAPGNWSVYNGTFGDGQRLRVAICGTTKHDKGIYLNSIKTCLDYFHQHIGKLPQEELNVVLAELPLPVDYMSGTPRLAVNRADRDWGMFEGMFWHYWFLRSVSYDSQYDGDRAWWFGEGASPFLLYPVYEAIGGASEVATAWGFKYNNLTWKNWYVVYEQYLGTSYNIPLVDYPTKNRETGDVQYYFPLPYMKGFLVLQMLNLSMAEVTHGTKDVRDVVKYVYENYAVKGIGYKIEDILSAVNTVSGNNYTAFFDAYVYGNETLPIVEKSGDYLFDWSTLGDKTYMSLANTEKVRPTPQYWGGQAPEGETATLLEMRKESQHFTVYFHQQDAKMAALLLLDSEKAYDADTKIYGGEERLKIKMFMTYNSTEYAILGGNPSAVYGEDASAGGVAVEAGDEINWLRPIRDRTQTQMYDVAAPIHELGHALMRQIYPNVYDNWEQWFNEGMPLSEMAWLDNEWAPEGYSPFMDHEPLRQLQTSLMGGSPSVIPLTQLAKMDYGSLNSSEQLLFEGQGITFHFYVYSRYDNGLQRLLTEYNRSVPLSMAVERAFGITYTDLEEELWAAAERAALHVNATDAVISRIKGEGADTSLAEKLKPEEPFLALLAAYASEARAGVGPESVSLGTIVPGAWVMAELQKTAITSLNVSLTQTAANVTVSVQEVTPDEAPATAIGEVYRYIEMTVSEGVGPATIAFKVARAWVNEHSANNASITLERYVSNDWALLPTKKISEDSAYAYFSAESPGLSTFSIASVSPADLVLQNKKETAHFIFYFNTTSEDFVDQYSNIAEGGFSGLEVIFGNLSEKIKVYLCETVEEFRITSGGSTPPNFDGTVAAGQCIDGKVQIYKPAQFFPEDYAIGLLHEIGHAAYWQLYPTALVKNNWLNEALAAQSISGSIISYVWDDEVKAALENGTFIPLATLESNGVRNATTEHGINGPEYISLVSFIAGEFGFDRLRSVLTYYNGSDNMVSSIEKGTGVSAANFEQRWTAKIRSYTTGNTTVPTVIEGWVSKEQFGQSATAFLPTDGIYVMVWNNAESDDQPLVTVRLVDSYGNRLIERSYNVPGRHGMTGFGDYNPGRSMTPGIYRVEIWSGGSLLQSIAISVSTVTADTTPPTITIISPAKDSLLQTSSVSISASYSDNVGIDVNSVTMKIDGATVTPIKSPNSVEYAASLSEGSHTVYLSVADTSGNTAVATWSFTISLSSSQQGSRCIIATSTYGSELAPQVQFLREFRDNLALKTFAGSSFMMVFNAWYYSWSPPVAASIAPDPSIKAVMRIILQPLLNILELAAATFSLLSFNSELGIVVAGIVASSLIGLVYFTPATVLALTAICRRRGSVPPVRKITFLVVPWAASLVLILVSEFASLQLLMMVATGTLVLSTITLVAGTVSLEIARYLRR